MNALRVPLAPTGPGALPHGLKVNLSFAAFPAMSHEGSARLALRHADASTPFSEPAWGPIWAEHVQLVPQNMGVLTESIAHRFAQAHPHTRFRLHANVRVLPRMDVVDVSAFHLRADWVERAAAVSRALKAPAYSAHSGFRSQCSLDRMLRNAENASVLFGAPVAIEGQYPTGDDRFLVSTWDEYRVLADSGVPYALDLSHLNILVHRSGQRKDELVARMLSSDRCLEVHVSDNDGSGDQHQRCMLGARRAWWWPALNHIHSDAIVFTEGNQIRQRLATTRFSGVVQ